MRFLCTGLALVSVAGLASCNAPPHASPAVAAAASAPPAPKPTVIPVVRVETDPKRVLNSFRPDRALGTSIDRLWSGSADELYSPEVLQRIMSSGWGAVTYRLNTELHVEAWHWNPKGSWSDPKGRGYFTGDATPGGPIRHSYGYPLPRRGYTRNEGTENEGYSRLTDGNAMSFWKSNPYLSHVFTGESDAAFPQWVLIDLTERRDVDAIRIAWANPYARSYRVQYWTGDEALKKPAAGQWVDFPTGSIERGGGGTVTHRLAPAPLSVRFVRVSMTASSETCAGKPADRRNCVGYAIYELQIGTLDAKGELTDRVRHSPSQAQTTTECSSVDPWHESTDLDPERRDQSGLDLFYTSGVTRGLPAMVPVAVLYGTPEDAAAEIAYLEKRGYPISYVELGEEADGQYMTPEHYAALYLQWAAALHKVDPKLPLGGPAFTGVNEDIKAWPDAQGKTSFFGRFLDYLKAHGRLDELAFMSFEHYPYEPCKIRWDDLYDAPRLIRHIMQVWRDDGLPANVPMLATEVNIAWQANQTSVDTFGGLWLADYTGAFLSAGGKESFYFQYFPGRLWSQCDATYGSFSMFSSDASRHVKQPLSQYFAAQLLTQEWAELGDDIHRVFPASSEVTDAAGRVVVTAYAVQRPDGQWSLLLVNKDPHEPHAVRIAFRDSESGRDLAFTREVSVARFGADNYVWHPDGQDGYAEPDGPLARATQPGGAGAAYDLPKASVTVLRGAVR
jgi:hypothetical protein